MGFVGFIRAFTFILRENKLEVLSKSDILRIIAEARILFFKLDNRL